jgi:hypothetical protein
MFEQLLVAAPKAPITDDSDLPFPAGTPFKGVVHASNFINGAQLATQIGLVNGVPINSDAGWLHFIEDNGYNVYIAKKPLRAGVTWQQIDTAQTGKEIIIGGKTFLVTFITGLKTAGMPAVIGNSGGQWNRYIYNVYGGEFASALPADRLNWGSYTEKMLGIPLLTEGISVMASFNYVKETSSSASGAHITRGMTYPTAAGKPNVLGVWYGAPSNGEMNYGWRPLLYEKGTTPPVPITPFKGEVAQADLITLAALRTATGYAGGTSLNPTAPWMMIVENGKTFYFPKAPLLMTMSREQLNAAGLVDGSKVITIAGKQYKVRLMTGRDTAVNSTSGGEWLRWMTNLTDGTWATYPTADLGGPYPMNGGMTHVWDRHGDNNWALSGYPGFLGAWYQILGSAADPAYGWRPVLELI